MVDCVVCWFVGECVGDDGELFLFVRIIDYCVGCVVDYCG